MPNPEKKSRVRFTYLVATRILRSWRRRNAVATSSRSAMLRTSIQACGTATTTLAKPKPSPSITTTRLAMSAIVSRNRSSPVMPRWTVPCFSAETAQQFVVAATRHQRAVRRRGRIVQLEHEAGVIVETTAIGGREANAADVDAARRQKSGAALEQVERRLDFEAGRCGERAK